MNNLAFLLLAVVVSVIGAAVVVIRHRPPVGRTEIDEFQSVMGALAPDRQPPPAATERVHDADADAPAGAAPAAAVTDDSVGEPTEGEQ